MSTIYNYLNKDRDSLAKKDIMSVSMARNRKIRKLVEEYLYC
jgi:hypothetical protein